MDPPLGPVSGLSTTTIVNVHEAKTRFSRLLEQAHQGQAIIVAKAGKPKRAFALFGIETLW